MIGRTAAPTIQYIGSKLACDVRPTFHESSNAKFQTLLTLPERSGRKGEGGLRTQSYYKFGYQYISSKWCLNGGDSVNCMEANDSCHAKFEGEICFPWPVNEKTTFSDKNIKSQSECLIPEASKLPLVSIITVVFNGERYLEQTIEAVLGQTYTNVEYIVVDGGSSDCTVDILRKYEGCIDYWVSEPDAGIYDAMNKGLSLASGQIVGIINADDYYDKDACLNVVQQFIADPEIGLIHGAMRVLDS